MSALTAIDVLLEPDEATRERARVLNSRLRASSSGAGFALDETHQAHVSLLQRYVRHDDLERVFAMVEELVASLDVATLRLAAVGIIGSEFGTPPGTTVASIDLEPTPALRALHESLVEAMVSFSRSGGDASSFVTTPDEAEVNASTIAYVEEFVPVHSGEHYSPHMTVGVGTAGLVEALESSHFDVFELLPGAVAVYQLGDLGTARRALWRRALRP